VSRHVIKTLRHDIIEKLLTKTILKYW